MARDGSGRLNWARLPLIAIVARLLCREQTLESEHLRVHCEVVRSKVPGRIRFTDEERRRLVDAALAMGRKAIWTFCGPRRAFVLVVMHLRSRTILLAEVACSSRTAGPRRRERASANRIHCTYEQHVEPLSFSVACGAQNP